MKFQTKQTLFGFINIFDMNIFAKNGYYVLQEETNGRLLLADCNFLFRFPSQRKLCPFCFERIHVHSPSSNKKTISFILAVRAEIPFFDLRCHSIYFCTITDINVHMYICKQFDNSSNGFFKSSFYVQIFHTISSWYTVIVMPPIDFVLH